MPLPTAGQGDLMLLINLIVTVEHGTYSLLLPISVEHLNYALIAFVINDNRDSDRVSPWVYLNLQCCV